MRRQRELVERAALHRQACLLKLLTAMAAYRLRNPRRLSKAKPSRGSTRPQSSLPEAKCMKQVRQGIGVSGQT